MGGKIDIDIDSFGPGRIRPEQLIGSVEEARQEGSQKEAFAFCGSGSGTGIGIRSGIGIG